MIGQSCQRSPEPALTGSGEGKDVWFMERIQEPLILKSIRLPKSFCDKVNEMTSDLTQLDLKISFSDVIKILLTLGIDEYENLTDLEREALIDEI